MNRARRNAWHLCLATTLAACSLAPDYQTPEMKLPQHYKEADAGNWTQAQPEKANTPRGPWWERYQDPELNTLEEKLTTANQNLKAALAQYEQARAVANIARADYFPTINADAGASRNYLSRNANPPLAHRASNDFLVGGDLSYELDLWGRVRNNVQANVSRADASAADMAAMDLSLHAELAMDYFAMRGQERTQRIANDTVVSYEKALKITQARHEGGASAEADVDQAETQLNNAKTLAADAQLKRAQLEHAIAVLVGEIPSSFSLADNAADNIMPPAMPQIPSVLLEQRPDIAAASLRVQAANAEIGVARAAYYPDITLSASAGYESSILSKLINAPSLFWSVGPSAVMPLFDGGRVDSLNDEARAAYDESVANYRQTVLTAFQEVEDNLVALRQLDQESVTQQAADKAANRALAQSQNRYKGGIDTYLNVVITQNQALQADLSSVDIRTRQLTASVLLIKALGGDYANGKPAPQEP